MDSTKTAGKLNRIISRSMVTKFPAKILGGLAIAALMVAASVSPLSAPPVLADEPAKPLVREVIISHDQLIDDLGEWGLVSAKAASFAVNYDDVDGYFTPTTSRITNALADDAEEDGYFLDAPAKIAPAVPSHNQLIDGLGEWGLVSAKAASFAVNYDDVDGYFTPTTSRITNDLADDAEEDGYFMDTPGKIAQAVPSHDQLIDDLGE